MELFSAAFGYLLATTSAATDTFLHTWTTSQTVRVLPKIYPNCIALFTSLSMHFEYSKVEEWCIAWWNSKTFAVKNFEFPFRFCKLLCAQYFGSPYLRHLKWFALGASFFFFKLQLRLAISYDLQDSFLINNF